MRLTIYTRIFLCQKILVEAPAVLDLFLHIETLKFFGKRRIIE